MSLTGKSISSSCPGKVLILGGYCILERPNPGLVLGVDARFHCTASWEEKQHPTQSVKISSPQWGENGWFGSYEFSSSQGLIPDAKFEPSPYIEKTVSWTLLFLKDKFSPSQSKCLTLELGGDNDFYSQAENLKRNQLPRNKQGLLQLSPQSTVRNKSSKTGLGSSAAMISCIVSTLLAFFVDDGNQNKETAHRVAQLCHSAVQGKIGSGFDISAAFFGSMEYIRYDASPALVKCMNNGEMNVEEMITCVKNDALWNQQIDEAFRLPKNVQLLCAEVENSGSETPSMSRMILDWKKNTNGGRPQIWLDLIQANFQASNALKELLRVENDSQYESTLLELSQMNSKDWLNVDTPMAKRFVNCFDAFLSVRKSLREMGEAASVPVEPPSQTNLCNATLQSVPGVLACGVPGAGGNDAIFALVLGLDAANQIDKFWETYEEVQVCPLLLRESKQGSGVIIENDSSLHAESKKMRT